jgi:hypothetical protein
MAADEEELFRPAILLPQKRRERSLMSIVTRSRSSIFKEVGRKGDCLAIPVRLVEGELLVLGGRARAGRA